MYQILITDPLPESAIELIKKSTDFEVFVRTDFTKPELMQVIPAYHGLIVRSTTKVTADLIDAAKNLKVIGRAGSGLDNIDVNHASAKGIEVLNTAGSNAQAVAELTIGLFFSLARNLHSAFSSLKEHRWEKSNFVGTEISGKTLGLVGFGQIGQRVGQLSAALGMRILVYKPTPVVKSPAFEYELADLDTVLRKSDFVSLHMPKTEKTEKLFSLKILKKMKPTAFLINCARGGIVVEKDLIKALDNNILAGAALDVFENEPPQEFDLIDHKKLIPTPHIAGSTHESQDRVGKGIVEQVMTHLETKYLFITGS